MKILQTIFLWLFFTLPLLAQQDFSEAYVPDNLPMAPEPAEFAKYVEIPVSKYTGVPEINIPLHNLQAGNLQLPINLSYHSNGIGVTQEATAVGLGWTLNAGGMITRSIHDLPDEMMGGSHVGWLQGGAWPYNPSDVLPPQTLENLTDPPTNGVRDKQPDVFYFNFGKYKGKFVFDDQGKHNNPKQNLKLPTKINAGQIMMTFTSFVLTVTKEGVFILHKCRVLKVGRQRGNIIQKHRLSQADMVSVKKFKKIPTAVAGI